MYLKTEVMQLLNVITSSGNFAGTLESNTQVSINCFDTLIQSL